MSQARYCEIETERCGLLLGLVEHVAPAVKETALHLIGPDFAAELVV